MALVTQSRAATLLVAAIAALVYVVYANWGAIVGWLAGLWETIRSNTVAALGALVDAFLNFTPLGLMIRAFLPVLSYLRSLDFAAIGRHLIDGLVNGMQAAFPNLTAIVGRIGKMLPDGLRKLLGIHSPSRVFAEIGGHVMSGLDRGLANNTSAPIGRMSDLSGQMTRALAIGAGSAAVAVGAPAMAQSGGAMGPAPIAVTYNVKIDVGAGNASATDIAAEVRKAIEQIERERRGRGFGDEGDY